MTHAHLPTADAIAQEYRDFAYSVSHDLGTPARAVVEFSRLLQEEQIAAFSEDGKLYLSLIMENGQKLQQMLAGLLDYSRLNTMAKNPALIDCNVIIDHCRLVLNDKIKSTGATFTVASLPHVKADADQAMQLFMALLDNALKFQAPGAKPHITISAEASDNSWLFYIRDNGFAIEPEFHEQIFKAFKRLHTDEEFPGIGMGLALAQKIILRHNGCIGVESSSSEGSVFYFTLPMEKPAHG